MLLTGFDSKYINTLYVDKNLKYHGLIQAFSRTNRVLNDTKPYGNILDFRGQQNAVEEAIRLFSGKSDKPPKEIWLVESAPVVIDKLKEAIDALDRFMTSQGVANRPEEVANLKSDEARGQFVNLFKDIQRLKTQLDQYTDLDDADKELIESLMPQDTLRAFRGSYLEVASSLRQKQNKNQDPQNPIEQLDFEFVLFASDIIDCDYIMRLISRYTHGKSKKQKMTKEQLVGIIDSDAKFLDEKEDIKAYIDSLEVGSCLGEDEIKKGYKKFKAQKISNKLGELAQKYGIDNGELAAFVELTISRLIFDAEKLGDLFASLGLGWRERNKKESQLMEELIPTLKKLAGNNEISGLKAYE